MGGKEQHRQAPSLALQACVMLVIKNLDRLLERPELSKDVNLRMRVQDLRHELKRKCRESSVFEFPLEVLED